MIYKGTIYCYKSPSGKYYIGQTINPRIRKSKHKSAAAKGSNYPFHKAIRKYGIESFSYKELYIVTAKTAKLLKEGLDVLERLAISLYKSKGRVLYNCSDGGEHVYNHSGEKYTEEHRNKISQGMKKWHANLSEEERAKIRRAVSIGRRRPILQYSLDGKFIQEWPSASDVPFAKQNAINNCLKGKSKSCAGFIWRYKDNE